ncbi:enoyl-CoA hydratase [Mycobacterium alsense]|uniref:Enoyl-CoA hydratase n=2 Tax=Mycobacterium alsense TaxID=324058 RepID=A0AA41XRR4_9MYCO|nr:enoyl-CoA hydratase-related protein [Mycobacterium alsense]MCV7380870.1 enoyl-CoA hydratase/isomerase family protein [Mycobacterium alsense]OQZ90526.1 enoyl-CoA hydratase [Mycobacterium alsense]
MSAGAPRVLDTGTDTVTAEIADGVGVITLNRPERRNALHAEMYEAVPRLLERYAGDDAVGSVLITGAGSAFCAGGDVRDGGSRPADPVGEDAEADVRSRAAALARNARMVQLLHEIPKVTIAALPGAAVGAGMSIALSADLRIAARSARLIPGWGRLAFSGDFGGAWFLTRLVGPSVALQLLVDGSPIDTDLAMRLGLLNRVVDDADLRSAALEWAAEIAAGPTGAWAGVKANIAEAQELPLAQALLGESERMVRCATSDEHRAAVRAWLDAATRRAAAKGDR